MALSFKLDSIATKLLSASVFSLALTAHAAAAPHASTVNAYAKAIHRINPAVSLSQSRNFAKHVLSDARRWRIDASIVTAIIAVESSWNTRARSKAGAIGLGQLMSGTAAQLRVNPFNPYENIAGTARYIAKLHDRFRDQPHSYALSYAAYNAGAQAVANYGGIPPYAETQRYVVKVTAAVSSVRNMVGATVVAVR